MVRDTVSDPLCFGCLTDLLRDNVAEMKYGTAEWDRQAVIEVLYVVH